MEQEVEIRTADGNADGVLYAPDSGGRQPGVLFLTDIGGIRAAQRQMAARLAAEGYTVLMPNIFYRAGRAPMFDSPFRFGEERTMQRIRELSAPVTPEAFARDASSYIEFLAKQPSVGAGPIGVVGLCFAGALAMRSAAVEPERVGAAASFHGGRLATDDAASPHLLLGRIRAELYFGHAVEDRSMPPEAIAKLEQALQDWGGRYESEVYEGAHHGWTVPDNPAYDPAQAERAFEKLRNLFARRLKAAGAGA
jgi:carboxymethylenebutenolidase